MEPWRREQLPTPVFRPGEFHGLYRPWGHKESDTIESLSLSFTFNGLAPKVALNSEKIGIRQVILGSTFIVIIGNISLYNSTIFLHLLPGTIPKNCNLCFYYEGFGHFSFLSQVDVWQNLYKIVK